MRKLNDRLKRLEANKREAPENPSWLQAGREDPLTRSAWEKILARVEEVGVGQPPRPRGRSPFWNLVEASARDQETRRLISAHDRCASAWAKKRGLTEDTTLGTQLQACALRWL